MLKARTNAATGCMLISPALIKPTTIGKATPAKPMAIPVTSPARKGRKAIIKPMGIRAMVSSRPARGMSPEESSKNHDTTQSDKYIKGFDSK